MRRSLMQGRMEWHAVTFDWNRARAFLVTAEEGTLSAAARALGVAQPTLGRQVTALEEELGVTLFDRVGRRLTLTPSGEALLAHVRGMGEAAARLSLAATGQSETVEGTVTVTASNAYAAKLLPPVVAALRREAPGIALRINATDGLADLRRREADIAIRNTRPTDEDLIARKLGDDRATVYGTPDYIARVGPFDGPADMGRAEFLGFTDNAQYIGALNRAGFALTEAHFPIRTESHLVHWELARQGLGLAVMSVAIGDADPGMRRAAPWFEPLPFPVWLVSHREVQTSARVRLVFDLIARTLPFGQGRRSP